MPYITASIIMQLMQGVIPAVGRWAKEGETGRRKITQVTRFLTLGLGLINAVGYLFLFKSSAYGVVFTSEVPEILTDIIVVFTLVAGTAFIMWMGELITQRGIGNGMSLIIFVSIVSRVPAAIFSSVNLTGDTGMGIAVTLLIVLVVLLCIPAIIFVERAQRRIPVNYAKRVQGRKMMGGQSTYIPLKVNAAGVIPIIFASCLIYFPAQIAALFNIGWLTAAADAMSTGWINWLLTLALIVFFAYFYTSMVFNPEETSDNLRKQGGFIPGVRPGSATTQYIKNVINRVTLPGGLFIALIAVVPSILFYFTGNQLIQAFGGTSILIMIGVALDTMSKLESQLKMYNYDGFFEVIENVVRWPAFYCETQSSSLQELFFVQQSRRFSAGKRKEIKILEWHAGAFPFIMLGLLGYARKGAQRDRIECSCWLRRRG